MTEKDNPEYNPRVLVGGAGEIKWASLLFLKLLTELNTKSARLPALMTLLYYSAPEIMPASALMETLGVEEKSLIRLVSRARSVIASDDYPLKGSVEIVTKREVRGYLLKPSE